MPITAHETVRKWKKAIQRNFKLVIKLHDSITVFLNFKKICREMSTKSCQMGMGSMTHVIQLPSTRPFVFPWKGQIAHYRYFVCYYAQAYHNEVLCISRSHEGWFSLCSTPYICGLFMDDALCCKDNDISVNKAIKHTF